MPPKLPEACLDDIPVGARFQDPRIAAAVSVTCSQLIGQSIREDIAAMFGPFHM
ncbi:hypothetical protein [Priestia filamentosa]|uniref:hypothetical protein n=1 Tax=Priestia filamentosa TaxID=1402861 RepID=UPI003D2C7991